MIFYTSDTHFYHSRCIQYDKRPYADVHEMNEAFIANWNNRVSSADTIYHLGDFSISNATKAQAILDRLNGQKHLVHGNHDTKQHKKMNGWLTSTPAVEIKDGEDTIYLHHYGCRVWGKSHYGTYHLYGHSHGFLPPFGRSLDVGVDSWNYAPVTLSEVKERLTLEGTIDEFKRHHKAEIEVPA